MIAFSDPKESSGSPVLVVVMGVSGSGKSTLGKALAHRKRWCYLDADDFHSAESQAHMASGKPLTDAMRKPWVSSICERLRKLAEHKTDTVLAFSGLKKTYREPLRHCGLKVLFLHLTRDRETLAQRMLARTNHFMPASLLDSQLESLETPGDAETDVHPLAIEASLEELVDQADRLVDEYSTQ